MGPCGAVVGSAGTDRSARGAGGSAEGVAVSAVGLGG